MLSPVVFSHQLIPITCESCVVTSQQALGTLCGVSLKLSSVTQGGENTTKRLPPLNMHSLHPSTHPPYIPTHLTPSLVLLQYSPTPQPPQRLHTPLAPHPPYSTRPNPYCLSTPTLTPTAPSPSRKGGMVNGQMTKASNK